MSELNEALILSRSKTFDLDTVFELNVDRCNLSKFSPVLSFCMSLHTLSLSHNALTAASLSAFPSLPQLQHLDLSYNRISNITLPSLPQLLTLNITHNLLSSLSSLHEVLHKCTKLVRIDIKSVDNHDENPLCNTATYDAEVTKLVSNNPQLTIVDCMRVNNNNNKQRPLAGGKGSKQQHEAHRFYEDYQRVKLMTEQWNISTPSSSSSSSNNKQDTKKIQPQDWTPNLSLSSFDSSSVQRDMHMSCNTSLSSVHAVVAACAATIKEADDIIDKTITKYNLKLDKNDVNQDINSSSLDAEQGASTFTTNEDD